MCICVYVYVYSSPPHQPPTHTTHTHTHTHTHTQTHTHTHTLTHTHTHKLKILDMIQQFKGMRLGNAIAEILREVPKDAEFADIVAVGFLSIRAVDSSFFSGSQSLQVCHT
jgi:hypothetical protein